MFSKKVGLGAFALALVSVAQAVPLTPDAYTPLPGITTIPGTVIEDVTQPFSFSAYGGTVNGEVQNRVTRKADNTLLFEWRVTSDRSAGAIQDFRLGNFMTSTYDGDWESAGLGDTNPTQAYLFSKPGGFVNFNFTPATGAGGLEPGHSSYFFYLNTDATNYAKVGAYDLTNIGETEISGQFSTFAPVPEPASVAVLGLGVIGLIRRRRAK